MPSSSTADMVITFEVEPGSNTSSRARSPRSATSASPGWFGSNVGDVASARTSPVFGFTTAIDPDSASVAWT